MELVTVALLLVLAPCMAIKLKVKDNGQCQINHGGCTYTLELREANCMQGDAPAGETSSDPSNDLMEMLSRGVMDNSIYIEGSSPYDHDHDATHKTTEESKAEMRKLDDLERKLTKMMEGLSVRSLRHIRKIRDDLRQMTDTMGELKEQANAKAPTNKTKRGTTCPSEFVSVGTWDSCYRFSAFNTTWKEAREYCSAFGADLVSLDTLKESYIMDYLIRSNPEYETANGWWTSGNYIARNRRWMWTTKHHLRNMSFSRWAPGEPNSRSIAHCLLLYRYANYMWHDGICSELQNFICEIPK